MKPAASDEVDFIAAPAYDGEIGILPGHTPLLTRLGTGTLRLKKGDEMSLLAVAGGFLEVSEGNHVSIYAGTAEQAQEINVERARLAEERARNQLASAKRLTEEELAQVMASLARAQVRLKVANLRKGHSSRGEG